jgi:acetyl esterase/lipase/D-arabinose 5-phosphate isomerase GutQ
MTLRRPPYDHELQRALGSLDPAVRETVTLDRIDERRRASASLPIDETVRARGVRYQRHETTAANGAPAVLISAFTPTVPSPTPRPAVFAIHGGGMLFGDRHSGVESVLDLAECVDAIAISPEYRLAPEHQHPAALDDCLASWEWMLDSAERLGIDSTRVVLVGQSAGGGIAATLCQVLRDRGIQAPIAQLLISPMLDDRGATTSTDQFPDDGLWDAKSNRVAWDAVLGGRHGEAAPPYASASRAPKLDRLPPAYLEVGSAEVFRDEVVNYATRIWGAGGAAELHVWSGAFHGSTSRVPHAAVSQDTRAQRLRWLKRIFETGRGREDTSTTVSTLIATEARAVEAVRATLRSEEFANLIDLLDAAPRLVTTGAGTSASVARRMAHLLSTSGTPAHFLSPTEALHGSIGSVAAGDALIAFSKGGQSAEINDILRRVDRRGAITIAVTCEPDSPIVGIAQHTIVLPTTTDSDPGGILAMGSTLAAAAWSDAVVLALRDRHGTSWAQVLDTHPAGAVGMLSSEVANDA